MPQPHDEPGPPPFMAAPLCSKCGHQMRLTGIEPHERLVNIDSRHFVGACGATETLVIARAI